MNDWIDDTGWIHYHSIKDPENRQITDGFGDSPHHTGFWITPLIWKNKLTKEIKKKFELGCFLRSSLDGFARHPRTMLPDGRPEMCNRDQLTAILYPIRELIGTDAARSVYEKTSMFLFPHQWMHMKRSLGEHVWLPVRWLCDSFEVLDILTDKISPNNSSIIKNHFRNELAKREQPTFVVSFNAWFLDKMVDVKDVFRQYFTYKHEGKDNPPPCHLEWFNYG